MQLVNGQLVFTADPTSPVQAVLTPANMGEYNLFIRSTNAARQNIFCTMDANNRVDCTLGNTTPATPFYFRNLNSQVNTNVAIEGYVIPNGQGVTASTSWVLQAVCP